MRRVTVLAATHLAPILRWIVSLALPAWAGLTVPLMVTTLRSLSIPALRPVRVMVAVHFRTVTAKVAAMVWFAVTFVNV